MNIGDRVRLLHGKEEGIVVNVKNDIVDIEIEDGFVIPAHKKEVVIVSREEAARFDKPVAVTSKEEKRTQIFAESGIFILLVPIGQTSYESFVINNTDFTLGITLFQDQKNKFKGIFAGTLKPKTQEYLNNVSLVQEELPEYVVHAIYFSEMMLKLKEPFQKRVRLKTHVISGEQRKAPVVGKTGFLIQIDAESIPVNPEKLKSSIEQNISKPKPLPNFQSPGKEIDLHIEKLSNEFENLSNSEILKIQLEVFETTLDRAIAAGQDEIKFIHGIGNGVLRKEIQKKLSRMKNIKYFEDVMKDRFGFGATLVRIK